MFSFYFFYGVSTLGRVSAEIYVICRIYPTVLKRIIGCHGNHAISYSSNRVIFRAILLPIEGGPTKQFDAHKKMS